MDMALDRQKKKNVCIPSLNCRRRAGNNKCLRASISEPTLMCVKYFLLGVKNIIVRLVFCFAVQVKVVLRVSPTLSADQGQSPVLQIDPAKKRVTIREPFGNCLPQTAMVLGRDGKNLLKTFNFDATYSQESSQVWFCPSIDPRWCIWIGRLYVVSFSMGFFFLFD